jgi:hypothetical protein
MKIVKYLFFACHNKKNGEKLSDYIFPPLDNKREISYYLTVSLVIFFVKYRKRLDRRNPLSRSWLLYVEVEIFPDTRQGMPRLHGRKEFFMDLHPLYPNVPDRLLFSSHAPAVNGVACADSGSAFF